MYSQCLELSIQFGPVQLIRPQFKRQKHHLGLKELELIFLTRAQLWFELTFPSPMYMEHLLTSSSPTKLLHFSHTSPSHVLNTAFSQLFHRWPLSQISLLKHRKGKDGCPRKCKKCVEPTKGLKNWPGSWSQTREPWKEEESRTRVNIPLAQKTNKKWRVYQQQQARSRAEQHWKLQLKILLKALLNWPELLAPGGGRRRTHSKTKSRTQKP